MICPQCQAVNPDTQRFCGECGISLTSSSEIPASVTKTLGTPIQGMAKESMFAGRYRIIEELGRGGMGVVYKAEDTKLKRTVALKFLPTELTHVSEIKERFMREAQAAAALNHPNICTVHEFDEAEEKTFISMAYVKGQSLKKKIESGPLELDETLRITIQAAEGLREAHGQGIIHRDIKSANIMVDEREQAKIMDFGLARMIGGTMVTREGATMGTIAYMSPEQARGDEVDHRTDIWSLGVVLYEMLSGQLPFKGEHEQAVMYSIFKEKPKPITDLKPEIPMAIEQVLGKAIEKNPEERYQIIEDFLDDLKSISEGIVPEGIRAKLLRAKLQRRKRAILYAGTAGLLIIMTVVVLVLFKGRAETIDRIAVLPLENLSGDPEQDYMVEGMHQSLINELGMIDGWRVIARTSVMRYKETTKQISEIAHELGVDAAIEGSVLMAGNQVQVNVRLIDGRSDLQLWSEGFDRDLGNILSLYSDISRAIAQEIKIRVTPGDQARLAAGGPVNPEAYEAYIRGIYFKNSRGMVEGAIPKSHEYFQKAVDLDPEFAQAYVGLASTYMLQANWNILAPREGLVKGREAALKALEMDDTLAEAYSIQTDYLLLIERNPQEAGRMHRRALELNPSSADAHQGYAFWLQNMGKFNEAIKEMKISRRLDPLMLLRSVWVGRMYYLARQYDAAINEYQGIIEMDPSFRSVYSWLAYAYLQKGMFQEALDALQKWRELAGFKGRGLSLAIAYAMSGKEEAREILTEVLENNPPERLQPGWIAVVYAALGKKDEAFAWLDKAVEYYDSWLFMLQDPFWDPLRSDPRFTALLQKMGLD